MIDRCSIDGLTLTADFIQYHLSPNRNTFDITLYLPGYHAKERSKYLAISFLLLDALLGEEDVETRIGRVDLLPLDAVTALPKRPLSELPQALDKLAGCPSA